MLAHFTTYLLAMHIYCYIPAAGLQHIEFHSFLSTRWF